MAGRFRVDHDSEGNAEVSPAKPRKLRPIDNEEDNPQPGATGQPPAGKSALKKSALKSPGSKKDVDEPSSTSSSPSSAAKPPANKQPKSALKSALKGLAPESLASAESNASAPPPPPKPALKSAMKSNSGSGNFQPTPPPPSAPPPTPGKPKSALKGRSFTNPEALEQKPAPTPQPAPPPKKEPVSRQNSGPSRSRPSMFKMTVEITDPSAWSARALCRHYFHFAGQRMLWDAHVANTTGGRKSIKLSDFALLTTQASAGGAAEPEVSKKASEGKRKSLVSSPHVILEDDTLVAAPPVDLANSEISPLKELLLAKKPNIGKLRDLLRDMSDTDRAKWIDASLDSTPPPMPAPLFHTVAAAQWDAVHLLVEFKVNVRAQYEGKSMLKGWIKPMTPLVECVRGRKGRFVGTMLGDKLEAVEKLLLKAEKEQQSGPIAANEAKEEEQKKELVPLCRKRTKSIHLKCSRGLMLHTQGHPNMKYELDDNFCKQSLSSVRAAIDTGTNQPFAIKAGSKAHEHCGGDPEALLWNEIVILRKLEHPNIIKLYETFEDDTHIFMVFELCKGGELFDRLVSVGSFSEKTVMRLAYQMGAAIRHVHELRICHRDIRPEAFMVLEEGPLDETCVKLIDFNTAKEISTQPLATKICTLHYVAPEVLTSQGYNEKVDIWSLGVVIYVMAAGVPPFDAENELDVLKAVKAGNFSFEPQSIWEEFSPGVKDLIKALMTRDPEHRPDISTVMEFPRMTQAEDEGAMYMTAKGDGIDKVTVYDHQRTIRMAFAMLSENIGDDQIIELRRIFRELDMESAGMVNIADCRSSLVGMLNGLPGVEELRDLLMSDKLSGKVNYAMFLATMTDKRRHIRREAARSVFNTFDIDKNGNVSLYEIAQALTRETELRKEEKGTIVNSKEIQAIWEEMREVFGEQEYQDKELSFEDFFKQLPRANLDICV